jgi:chromosome condensin MukBEF complex kleisin-like MukF subunit
MMILHIIHEAQTHGDFIRRSLKQWIDKWKSSLDKHELKFIRTALNKEETDPNRSNLYHAPSDAGPLMWWHPPLLSGHMGR